MVSRLTFDGLGPVHPAGATPPGEIGRTWSGLLLISGRHKIFNGPLRAIGLIPRHPDLGSVNDRQTNLQCVRVYLDSAAEPVVIGDAKGLVPELRRASHKLPSPRRAVEKRVIGVTMQLSVSTHQSSIIEHVFDYARPLHRAECYRLRHT